MKTQPLPALPVRSIRAKFAVLSVTGGGASATVTMEPQYDETVEEDQKFCQATPWGHLQMFVDNPRALELLKPGQQFYLDLTPVPATGD